MKIKQKTKKILEELLPEAIGIIFDIKNFGINLILFFTALVLSTFIMLGFILTRNMIIEPTLFEIYVVMSIVLIFTLGLVYCLGRTNGYFKLLISLFFIALLLVGANYQILASELMDAILKCAAFLICISIVLKTFNFLEKIGNAKANQRK